MFMCNSITPHFFQLIKFPCFRKHHMYHHIYIIDQNPLQVLHSFVAIRIFITFLFHFLFYKIRNSPDLRLVTCFTNNKKIRNSFIYFSQVK